MVQWGETPQQPCHRKIWCGMEFRKDLQLEDWVKIRPVEILRIRIEILMNQFWLRCRSYVNILTLDLEYLYFLLDIHLFVALRGNTFTPKALNDLTAQITFISWLDCPESIENRSLAHQDLIPEKTQLLTETLCVFAKSTLYIKIANLSSGKIILNCMTPYDQPWRLILIWSKKLQEKFY